MEMKYTQRPSFDGFSRDILKRGKHHLHKINCRIHKKIAHSCTHTIYWDSNSHKHAYTQIHLYINQNPFTHSILPFLLDDVPSPLLNNDTTSPYCPCTLKHISTTAPSQKKSECDAKDSSCLNLNSGKSTSPFTGSGNSKFCRERQAVL